MPVTSTHSCDTPQCLPDIAKCPSGGPAAVHEKAQGGKPLNQLMPLLCGGVGVPHGQPVTQGSRAKSGQTPQAGFGLRAPPLPPPVQSSPGVGPVSSSSVAGSQLHGCAESGGQGRRVAGAFSEVSPLPAPHPHPYCRPSSPAPAVATVGSPLPPHRLPLWN